MALIKRGDPRDLLPAVSSVRTGMQPSVRKQATARGLPRDFYSEIGHKGSERVRELVAADGSAVAPEAGGMTPGEIFGESRERRGLAIRDITLTRSLRHHLPFLRQGPEDLFIVAWAWDMSGHGIVPYPGEGMNPQDCVIRLDLGVPYAFLGSGAMIFPPRIVVGGIGVRIQLWQYNGDSRRYGEMMKDLAGAINGDGFGGKLVSAALLSGGTAAVLGAIETASQGMSQMIGSYLSSEGDKHVDLFEGYYAAADEWREELEEVRRRNSKITLAHVA